MQPSLEKIKRAKQAEEREDEREVEEVTDLRGMFDKPLREPILGKHFVLPGRSAIEQRIKLDTSQLYIPVYTHLKVYPSDMIENLPIPPIIGQLKAENYLDHYMPVVGKTDPTCSAINIREPPRAVRVKTGSSLGKTHKTKSKTDSKSEQS